MKLFQFFRILEGRGEPCVQGETAAKDGCIPDDKKMKFKVKPPKKLYRGVMSSGKGAGTYSLGKGLYSTPRKSFLKGLAYDKIVELDPEEAFPRNPLVLREPSQFADWLIEKSGLRNIRQFNEKYSDPGEFVRQFGYDGVIAGDEVVKYSEE